MSRPISVFCVAVFALLAGQSAFAGLINTISSSHQVTTSAVLGVGVIDEVQSRTVSGQNEVSTLTFAENFTASSPDGTQEFFASTNGFAFRINDFDAVEEFIGWAVLLAGSDPLSFATGTASFSWTFEVTARVDVLTEFLFRDFGPPGSSSYSARTTLIDLSDGSSVLQDLSFTGDPQPVGPDERRTQILQPLQLDPGVYRVTGSADLTGSSGFTSISQGIFYVVGVPDTASIFLICLGLFGLGRRTLRRQVVV